MASTGCGKTFANAKVMLALSPDNDSLRYTLALGLRTLTLQTGDEYRDRIFKKSDGSDMAVLIGSKAIADLHQRKEAQEHMQETLLEKQGSESAEKLLDSGDEVICGCDFSEQGMNTVLKTDSSVSKLYAWAADRSGKAGPRRCLFGHADEMKPVQIPVQILRGDAAIATQEILQLAVATVDRLDVKGIPDPLSGRKLERLVANAHGGSAGPITAFAVGDENDIGVHRRFEDSFQRVRVDRRKNFADRRAAAVGSDQNRNLLMRQSALAGFAPAPPGLAVQCARSLVALKHISLVNLNDPLEFLRGLPHGRQEPVPPSEGRIDAKPAPAGRFPDRLALSQRRAERQPPFLVMKPRQRRSGRGIERAPAALALVAAKTPCPAA